jgi:hypothetical protein
MSPDWASFNELAIVYGNPATEVTRTLGAYLIGRMQYAPTGHHLNQLAIVYGNLDNYLA